MTLPAGDSLASRKARIALISPITVSFPPLAPCPNDSVGSEPNGYDGGPASPLATSRSQSAGVKSVWEWCVDESASRRRIGSVEPGVFGLSRRSTEQLGGRTFGRQRREVHLGWTTAFEHSVSGEKLERRLVRGDDVSPVWSVSSPLKSDSALLDLAQQFSFSLDTSRHPHRCL